jgi:hypothetical protein
MLIDSQLPAAQRIIPAAQWIIKKGFIPIKLYFYVANQDLNPYLSGPSWMIEMQMSDHEFTVTVQRFENGRKSNKQWFAETMHTDKILAAGVCQDACRY